MTQSNDSHDCQIQGPYKSCPYCGMPAQNGNLVCSCLELPALNRAFMRRRTEKKLPRYNHECEYCEHLGNYQNFDLYFCNDTKMVVARSSNDEYIEEPLDQTTTHATRTARHRYLIKSAENIAQALS